MAKIEISFAKILLRYGKKFNLTEISPNKFKSNIWSLLTFSDDFRWRQAEILVLPVASSVLRETKYFAERNFAEMKWWKQFCRNLGKICRNEVARNVFKCMIYKNIWLRINIHADSYRGAYLWIFIFVLFRQIILAIFRRNKTKRVFGKAKMKKFYFGGSLPHTHHQHIYILYIRLYIVLRRLLTLRATHVCRLCIHSFLPPFSHLTLGYVGRG